MVGLVQGGSDEVSVWWESTLDGLLDTDGAPDEDGVIFATGTLSEGTHELWLYAEDYDQQAFDSITVSIGPDGTVEASGEALTVALLSPVDGSTHEDDEQISFQGMLYSSDSSSGWGDLSVRWNSSIDGTLTVDDYPDSEGRLEGTTTLSAGTHTITLSVSDGDDSHEDSISIEVLGFNFPPQISISTPSDGSSFESDDQIYLKASVSDKEDDPTALEVSWSSSLDGHLITVYGEKDGAARGYSTLSVGSHTLTAIVTDSRGELVSTSTTVSITKP
ncbi:MAG: hypothetical protein P8R54_04415 [Myxococcota bacterium]|nr:hypothetical protein [Myxococcota bacterium]